MDFELPQDFFLLLNKQKRYSSNGELNCLKHILGVGKAGFCGTLDPLAEGLLIIAIGRGATKLISLAANAEKSYSGELLLGFRSASFDCGTELVPSGEEFDFEALDCTEIEKKFTGTISQVPPVFSALKIDGVRAYRLARAGKMPEMKPRSVEIKSLKIQKLTAGRLRFSVDCSKGTYIRSLVADIGDFLGCGATMTALRREKVGPFSVENSVSIPELREDPASIARAVVTVEEFALIWDSVR